MNKNEFFAWIQESAVRADPTNESAKLVGELLSLLPDGGVEAAKSEADSAALGENLKRVAEERLQALGAVLKDGSNLVEAASAEGVAPGQAFTDWLEQKKGGSVEERQAIERLQAFLREPGREGLREAVVDAQDVAALQTAVKSAQEELTQAQARAGLPQRMSELHQQFAKEGQRPPQNLLEFIGRQEAAGDKLAGPLRRLLQGSRLEGAIRNNQVQLAQILALIDERSPAGRVLRGRNARLKAAAVEYFADFFSSGIQQESQAQVAAALLGPSDSWAQWLAIGSIILAAVFIIGFFLWSPERLSQLSDISLARGFITFIFTIGTISLFLVITASTVFDNSPAVDKYNRAKTILSMLVGIFGTVLGYYFGLPEGRGGDAGAKPALELREIERVGSESELEKGRFTLLSSVAGGEAPFTYFLKVFDGTGKLMPDASRIIARPSGTFLSEMAITPPDSQTEYTIWLRAEDAEAKVSEPSWMKVTIGKPQAAKPKDAGNNS